MAETYPYKFGKYILLKPMARGGMGEIYLAATGDVGFQKLCVIKKVIAEKTDRVKANRFLDEAKVVLRLAHANLVPTFDAGEVDGEFFIAMELVEGKDLREIWNRCVRTRTRIPLDVALHVGREIARALAYVHSNGDLRLVHRDVAPPNILVSYFGEVKLTDFGLARSVLKQENTAPGVVFGRASYLSPEQARGEIADSRTDIYSLGIVLWELVTGNQYLQLANLDPATAMSLVRHPRVQPPSSKAPWITPNLDALLMRALAPAREDRFQSAEEMRKSLSEIIAQISPRADAERAADFLRGLYDTAIKEERAEREQLLAGSAALFAPPAAPERPSGSRIAVPLAALELGSTRLQFPKEEDDALGVDFTGRVIDNRYKVLRKIGEGGMGTVYAGEHVEIGKGVAIKILHPAYSTQSDLVERFRREARAASRIGHPNIIDVTDFGSTEDGCAYFVMEHLDGIDLADVLSHERRLAPGRCCQIAIQICRALSAAHAAGVIHRDLKPENIFLVARDGQADFVKVLDFGIARSMGRARRLTNPGVAMGTPEYMAPEQAEGGAVDQRSDIFSVGALIYEMVSGSPPQMTR
ncbi:MAG TPA: serine/threonine-protein kinase, partial [Polyangia bacterium]